MIIKTKNKNKYILDNKIYIRDFTNDSCIPVDLNELANSNDQDIFIENEMNNFSKKYPEFEMSNYEKIIIINSGFDFKNKQTILSKVDKKVCIIAVNDTLNNWTLLNKISGVDRSINYYVVNNPYEECINFLPKNHNYYPKCIASTRTNSDFLKLYKGNKYLYNPTPNINYSGLYNFENKIDDYRNSICASLDLSFKFNVSKIFLFCCDESFDTARPGSISIEDNLHCYPQQLISNMIIGHMCYWLKNKKIEIYNYSNGGIINNTIHLKNDDEFLNELSN